MMPISSISSSQLALSPRLELFAACAVTTTPLTAGALTAAVKQLIAAASKGGGAGAADGGLAGLSVRFVDATPHFDRRRDRATTPRIPRPSSRLDDAIAAVSLATGLPKAVADV